MDLGEEGEMEGGAVVEVEEVGSAEEVEAAAEGEVEAEEVEE